MLFVTGQERNRRLEICRACKYFKPATQSCGTILRPNTLRNGVYLCGCHMPTKTRFKAAGCGAGKWEPHINEADRQAMESVVTMKGQLTPEQTKEIVDTYNRITGSNERYTSCGSCLLLLQRRIDEILTYNYESEVKEASIREAARAEQK